MKYLAVCLLPLLSSLAFADLTLVEKTEGIGEMTIKIKGENIRVDQPGMSLLLNNKSGEMTTIVHANKAYFVVPKEQVEAMVPTVDAEGKPIVAPELKPSGEKEKIKIESGEYEAQKYVFDNGSGVKGTYWVVADYPNGKAILEQFTTMTKGPLGQMLGSGSPDLSKLPGIPVKTTVEMEEQQPLTTVISSTSDAPIADEEFKIPAGYKKMDMPGAGSEE